MRAFALTLLPAALAAQAPAASQPAPSLADQIKAQLPAITGLAKTDPSAALAKAEALIPAAVPPFDKSDIGKAQASMNDYNALTDLYRNAANCADAAGQWEKAKNYAEKAKVNAQTTYDNSVAPFTAFQDSWRKAQADAQKNLDERDSLAKMESLTAEQGKRLDFLRAHEGLFQENIASGKTMIDAIDARLKDLKAQPGDFEPFLSGVDARLKRESEYLVKFKSDKKAYAAAALKSADEIKDKDAEVTYLRRLQVLDPSSKAIARKIDVLLGKAKDEPAKPSKKAARTKKGH